jgi:large subunit ribosomal protein L17
VFSYLESKEAVTELFREVSTKVAERPGGYTRILKLGQRLGDSADMAIIELVDFNTNLLETKETGKAKTTRRAGRRGAGKKKEDAAVDVAETPKAKKSTGKKATAEPVKEKEPEPVKEKEPEPVKEQEPELTAETEEPAADQPEADNEEETKA